MRFIEIYDAYTNEIIERVSAADCGSTRAIEEKERSLLRTWGKRYQVASRLIDSDRDVSGYYSSRHKLY